MGDRILAWYKVYILTFTPTLKICFKVSEFWYTNLQATLEWCNFAHSSHFLKITHMTNGTLQKQEPAIPNS